MQIADFLSPDDIMPDVRASDKGRLLMDLSSRAASALQFRPELVSDEIMKREQLGSTGLGDGIAIPHARFHALSKPFGILARLRKGVDFAAIDAKPVDLVFLLLLPAAPDGEQLTALASVARKLRDQEVAARLRGAVDSAGIHRAITA